MAIQVQGLEIISVKDLEPPHPTSTTAAIVVISMCFISLQLSILHPSCRRVFGGGRRFSLLSSAEKLLNILPP